MMDNMLRFIRSKIPVTVGHGDSRLKEGAEFVKFAKVTEHGFPSKASCLAYDPELNLGAIGSATGAIKVFGRPGVEFAGHHQQPVKELFFLSNQGRLISRCDNGSFHLWEVNFRDGQSRLDHVKECETEGKIKNISCCGLYQSSGNEIILLVGTESGNIYQLNCQSLELSDYIIYQDVVIQNIPDDYKLNPGAVEAICVHPSDPNKLLIGYNRGLIVLWDASVTSARQTCLCSQQVESISWHEDGQKFVSSHNDGSIVVWDSADCSKPVVAPNAPYGPFPCKPITKILWKKSPMSSSDDGFTIFTGGMPRASFGDRHTVSIIQGEKQVVLDFGSPVVDLAFLDAASASCADGHCDRRDGLMVLCEEELVTVDLASPDWPVFATPYLHALHADTITEAYSCPSVAEAVWDKIVSAGKLQQRNDWRCSSRDFPIQGGEVVSGDGSTCRDLLITGHQNGEVKFWNAGGTSLDLMLILDTARLFSGSDHAPSTAIGQDEEGWPPFRKVGNADPSHVDDVRFAVQRIIMDAQAGLLVVGGAAGQIILWSLVSEEREQQLEAFNVNLISEDSKFVWKDHEPLMVADESVKYGPGFAPKCMIQLNPPSASTVLAIDTSMGLVGIGTAHGFLLFDYIQKQDVYHKETLLSDGDITAHGTRSTILDGSASKLRTIKKSLRDSFRAARRRHDTPSQDTTSPDKSDKKDTESSPTAPEETEKKTDGDTELPKESTEDAAKTIGDAPVTPKADDEISEQPIIKPIVPEEPEPAADGSDKEAPDDKEVAKSSEEPAASGEAPVEDACKPTTEPMVRTMLFAKTYVLNGTTTTPTFFTGTNAGTVRLHSLSIPEGSSRETEPIKCEVAKEIQLRHGAPIMGLAVVDSHHFPIDNRPVATGSSDETTPATEGGSPDQGHHRLIIVSEEQLKSFHLPTLKAIRHKYKMAAADGARVRKLAFANFMNKSGDKTEPCIVIVNNHGEVDTYTIQHFHRYLREQAIKRDDLSGINSAVLSRSGYGFHLLPTCGEYERFTLSHWGVHASNCTLNLPEGSRPVPEQVAAAEKTDQIESAEEAAVDEKTIDVKDGEKKELASEAAEKDDVAPLSDTSLGDVTHDSATGFPGDVTVDSIRDYTTSETKETVTTDGSGIVTVTTKVTKTSIASEGGAKEVIISEIKQVTGAGELTVHESDEDDIAKMKALAISEAAETITAPPSAPPSAPQGGDGAAEVH